MKCDEIFLALAMLEKERGISQTFMMDKIVQALTTAYKRDHEGVENVVVDVDESKKDLKMYVQKEAVEEVEFPGTQMSVEEAKALSAKYVVGDIVNIPVDNVEFGRIAAGNGKQVIIQGLREAESGMVYEEYNSKQHEILTGVVSQIDPRTGGATLRIGTGTDATNAFLTKSEQVVGEELVEGQRIKVYLVDVRRGSRGAQVVISRTHPGLVKRLFELFRGDGNIFYRAENIRELETDKPYIFILHDFQDVFFCVAHRNASFCLNNQVKYSICTFTCWRYCLFNWCNFLWCW